MFSGGACTTFVYGEPHVLYNVEIWHKLFADSGNSTSLDTDNLIDPSDYTKDEKTGMIIGHL
jgi:hypothetical protein